MAALLILLGACRVPRSRAESLQPRFQPALPHRSVLPSRGGVTRSSLTAGAALTPKQQRWDPSSRLRSPTGERFGPPRRRLRRGSERQGFSRVQGSEASIRRQAFLGDQQDEDPTSKLEREKEKRKENEFIVNKGKVIDTVRDDLPRLFDRAPDLKMFRDDVRLHICVQRLGLDSRITGKRAYKGWFDGLKWTSRAIFDAAVVSQVVIRKDFDPFSPTIRVRWTVKAHPWLSMKGGYPVHLDFVSVFELDETGRVQEHALTDVEPPPQISTTQDFVMQAVTPAAVKGDQAWPLFTDDEEHEEAQRHW